MNAAELYKKIETAFGADLKKRDIEKGQSFFWREHRVGPASTRVLRIHEDSAGRVIEIKLPVTSNRTKTEAFLPPTASVNDVIIATQREIDGL